MAVHINKKLKYTDAVRALLALIKLYAPEIENKYVLTVY